MTPAESIARPIDPLHRAWSAIVYGFDQTGSPWQQLSRTALCWHGVRQESSSRTKFLRSWASSSCVIPATSLSFSGLPYRKWLSR